MKIVSYLDNDMMNKPNSSGLEVYTQLTKEKLVNKYPKVFGEGVGCLEGEYHIRLIAQVDPVQHAPRRVPVALRECLQETHDGLIQQDILALVTEPTSWVNSMVAVSKKDGKLYLS